MALEPGNSNATPSKQPALDAVERDLFGDVALPSSKSGKPERAKRERGYSSRQEKSKAEPQLLIALSPAQATTPHEKVIEAVDRGMQLPQPRYLQLSDYSEMEQAAFMLSITAANRCRLLLQSLMEQITAGRKAGCHVSDVEAALPKVLGAMCDGSRLGAGQEDYRSTLFSRYYVHHAGWIEGQSSQSRFKMPLQGDYQDLLERLGRILKRSAPKEPEGREQKMRYDAVWRSLQLGLQLGHIRQLFSNLTSSGKFAYLNAAADGFWRLRFPAPGSKRPKWLEDLYNSCPGMKAAFEEVARGTVYEFVLRVSSVDEVVNLLKQDGRELSFWRPRSRSFKQNAELHWSMLKEEFLNYCRRMMIAGGASDGPKFDYLLSILRRKEAGGQRVLVRVEEAEHARFLADLIGARLSPFGFHAGWFAGASARVAGGTEPADMNLERFQRGEINVLVSTQVIDYRGVQSPVDTLVMYSPVPELEKFLRLVTGTGQPEPKKLDLHVCVTAGSPDVPRYFSVLNRFKQLQRRLKEGV